LKKLLISAYSLDYGGIETALITLLEYLKDKYEITLVLEKKQGVFLKKVPQNVEVISYEKSKIKNTLFRKIDNFIRQTKFKMKYKNKFDFSICYATYSLPCSFVARTASKNSALWVHNNYMNFYNNDIQRYKKFFYDLKIEEFKKIIFVSNLDKTIFSAEFPMMIKKCYVCNNLINYESILEKSEEQVDDFKKSNLPTFINISRHDEKQKKLSRIINATRKLNKEGYKFRVVFVGKGIDTKSYYNMAKDLKNVIFLGAKTNPYPYLRLSDCFVMSSEFEGYPVTLVEAEILSKPIITTDISDAKEEIDKKYGIIVEKSDNGIYEGMKQFLDEGIEIDKFSPEKYNEDIIKKLEKIFN